MFKDPKNIHEAIVNVMEEVGYVQKTKGKGLAYTYAGEAALIAAIRPELVTNNITVSVVEITNYSRDQYKSKSGSSMTNTTLMGKVRFTHATSDTFIEVISRGEAADVGDKSGYKAQTGMYKYALRQLFVIETGDDPDNFSSEKMEREVKKESAKADVDKKVWMQQASKVKLMENPKDKVQLENFKVVLGDTISIAGEDGALEEGLRKIKAWHSK